MRRHLAAFLFALIPAVAWGQTGICPNTMTYRLVKGSSLTYAEGDANFENIGYLCVRDVEDFPTSCGDNEFLVASGGSMGCATLPAHESSHRDGGSDELVVTNQASPCTDAQVLGGTTVTGGVECQADDVGTDTLDDLSDDQISALSDVSETGADTGEALVSNGAGSWAPSTAAVILEGDSRLTDARTPTSHATSHSDGQSDEIVATNLASACTDAQVLGGTATPGGVECQADDTGTDTLDDLSDNQVGDLSDVSETGADAGEALVSNGAGSWAPSTAAVILEGDSRLTDARTPTSHASTHQNGGGDQMSLSGLSVDTLAADALDDLGEIADALCGTNEILEDQGGSWACISTPGGADLTVEEADASPSVSNVDTIQFDQADGFTVTDETGGQVQIDLASVPDSVLATDYSGTGSCTNQVVTAVNDASAPTCSDVTASEIAAESVGTSELDDSADTPAADDVVMVDYGDTSEFLYAAMPTGGTDGCAGEGDVLGYNTTTHTWVCTADAGAGGGMTSFTVEGDDGSTGDTITDGNTLTIAGGAGIATDDSDNSGSDTTTISTDSSEADFLANGALTCGASTQGKAQVHTTPLQYCDNAATPALQYAAYGASDGDALAGDSATGFFDAGTIENTYLPAATTSASGIVELATDGESASGVAVQGNDSRLSDARTPTAHASSHNDGGSDQLTVENLEGACTDAQVYGGKAGGGVECQADDTGTDTLDDLSDDQIGTLSDVSETGADTGEALVSNGAGSWAPSSAAVILEGDARLTDARTPTSHATSHELSGGDEMDLSGLEVDTLATGALDAIGEINSSILSGVDGTLITGTISTTNAVIAPNADDDLVEYGAPLVWNVTAATCTGDGNDGALTVNGSNEIVCSADDGGGSSLTVEEADASPSVSNVDTIQFNQADGFVVTDETGGQVQVDLSFAPGLNYDGDANLEAVSEGWAFRIDADDDGTFDFQAEPGALEAVNTNGGAIINETASETNPTLTPSRADLDTGIARGPDVDEVSIVGGGYSIIKARNAGANNMHVEIDAGSSQTSPVTTWRDGSDNPRFWVSSAYALVWEGTGLDDYETTLSVTNPTGDHTIDFPDDDIADDDILMGDGAGSVSYVAGPSGGTNGCSGSTTDKVLYNSSTNTWSCGTDQGAGGGTTIKVDAANPESTVDFVSDDSIGGDFVLNTTPSPDEIQFDLDLTEINSHTWGDNSQASFTVTYDQSGVVTGDPVWTISDGSMDLTAGTLKQGGTAVSTGSHFSPTAGIDTDHGAGAIDATTDFAGTLCGTAEVILDGGASWSCQGTSGTGDVARVDSPTFTTAITVPDNSISDEELDEGGTFTWTGTQDASGATLRIASGASNPGTCAVGDVYFNTTSNNLQVCRATDTWEDDDDEGAGGGSSISAGDSDVTVTDAGTGDATVTIDSGVVGVWTAGGLQIGSVDATDQLVLPQSNDSATPTVAFGDGDTGFYEAGDDQFRVAISGNSKWRFDDSALGSVNTGYPALQDIACTKTAPNISPNYVGDLDTGLGCSAGDDIFLIAGGATGFGLYEGQLGTSAGDVVLELYDVATAPTSNPGTDDIFLYANGDSLWIRKDDGTTVDLGGSASGTTIQVDGGGGESTMNIVSADSTGIDWVLDTASSPDEIEANLDLTEINDTTWGDNTDSTIVHTFNPSGALLNPAWSYTDSGTSLNSILSITPTTAGSFDLNVRDISAEGIAYVGVGAANDTEAGNLTLYSNATQGGSLAMKLGGDYDGTIDSYGIQVYEDDFRIGTDVTAGVIQILAGGAASALVIDSDGDIAMNASAPSANVDLDVVSAANAVIQSRSTGADTAAYLLVKNDVQTWGFSVATNDDFLLTDTTYSLGVLRINPNAENNALVIDADGEVALDLDTTATAITQAADDNDTSVASTAFVQQEINGSGGTAITCTSGSCSVDTEVVTRTFSFNLEAPTTGDNGVLQHGPGIAGTITRVQCSTDTGTADIDIDKRAYATPNSNGTDVIGTDIQCDNDSTNTTSFSSATFSANDWLALEISATASTPGWLRVSITYTVNDV